ncbi:MAG: ABC transporter substrate-binding protein [Synergistaceae bacterium]|nr:ABC transporter substrate-binding protein [Synergistaceae bacterium]
MKSLKKGILIIIFLLCIAGSGVARFRATAGVAEIVDDMGVAVSFEKPVIRVISLYAGHTENLIAIGARDRLVAVSNGDDPEITGSLPRLGVKPGVEQIAALRPDVVLTRPMHVRAQAALYERLQTLGVKVLAIDPPVWEEFPAYIELLSRMVGAEKPELIAEETRHLLDASRRVGKNAGAILITNGRNMATCTANSWAAHIMERAGLSNAAPDAAPITSNSVIADFGTERLLASDKHIEVVLLQQGAMNTVSATEFMSDPRFSGMRAVREGNVFDISEADISRPSLLRLRRGVIEDLGKIAVVGR